MASQGPVGGDSAGPVRAVAFDLGLALDRDAPGALPDQLEDAIRRMVGRGELSAGVRLPSSRGLAAQLGVSRGVVVEAYDRLQRQGVLHARAGAGVRVADAIEAMPPSSDASIDARRFAWRFHPALVPHATFDRRAWRTAALAALTDLDEETLRDPAPGGVPALRAALVEQLRRSRGINGDAADVVVTGGVTDSLGRLAALLRSRGTVAVEEPGFVLHRATLAAAGCSVVSVATDASGINVDALARSGAASVLLTPAHQMPLGVPLSGERRAAVLRWAQASDGVVLEDDYDGELRYDRRSVRALQALDPSRVVYLGTTSKVLSPAVRIGWMVVPPALRASVGGLAAVAGGTPGTVEQHALAVLLKSGAFDRGVARLRRRCAVQRAALTHALATTLPSVAVDGVQAGLALTLRLPGVDAAAVMHAADVRDVELYAVPDGSDAVVLVGFGDVHESRAKAAAVVLAAIVAEASGAPALCAAA